MTKPKIRGAKEVFSLNETTPSAGITASIWNAEMASNLGKPWRVRVHVYGIQTKQAAYVGLYGDLNLWFELDGDVETVLRKGVDKGKALVAHICHGFDDLVLAESDGNAGEK
jgi:hypothetical protein